MIEYRKGDIFESGCDALVIPVNCSGAAGRGLALAAKKRWPEWFANYKREVARGRVEIGHIGVWTGGDGIVFNFPTKQHWRDPSRIEWIRDGLATLAMLVRAPPMSIGIPGLGCGLGGLRWADVRPLIEAAFADSPARVVVYEP